MGTPSAHGTLSDRWEIQSAGLMALIKMGGNSIFGQACAALLLARILISSVQDHTQGLALISPSAKHFLRSS